MIVAHAFPLRHVDLGIVMCGIAQHNPKHVLGTLPLVVLSVIVLELVPHTIVELMGVYIVGGLQPIIPVLIGVLQDSVLVVVVQLLAITLLHAPRLLRKILMLIVEQPVHLLLHVVEVA